VNGRLSSSTSIIIRDHEKPYRDGWQSNSEFKYFNR